MLNEQSHQLDSSELANGLSEFNLKEFRESLDGREATINDLSLLVESLKKGETNYELVEALMKIYDETKSPEITHMVLNVIFDETISGVLGDAFVDKIFDYAYMPDFEVTKEGIYTPGIHEQKVIPARTAIENNISISSNSIRNIMSAMVDIGFDHIKSESYQWFRNLYANHLPEFEKALGNQDNQLSATRLITAGMCDQEFEESSREILERHISDYGIDGVNILQSWLESDEAAWTRAKMGRQIDTDFLAIYIIWENLNNLDKLEKAIPGGAKELVDKFGIKCFGRYSPDILIEQLKDENDPASPYGVIIYPLNDINGTFYEREELINQLMEQCQRMGLKIKIVEAGNTLSIYRRLVQLGNRYSIEGENKIQFAIIGGHGDKYSIRFGQDSYEDTSTRLTSETLLNMGNEKRGVRASLKLRNLFVENPSIILDSCSTGIDQGIGQHLSNVFQATVTGPQEPMNIKELIINRLPSGRVELNAVYYSDEKGIFVKGD